MLTWKQWVFVNDSMKELERVKEQLGCISAQLDSLDSTVRTGQSKRIVADNVTTLKRLVKSLADAIIQVEEDLTEFKLNTLSNIYPEREHGNTSRAVLIESPFTIYKKRS